MKQLLVATSNQGKIAEFRQALESSRWKIVTPTDINLGDLDVPETGTTFAENATIKAKAYSEKSGLVTIADDSGLVVKSLNGRPGVYSARYGKTDAQRNQKILRELSGQPNRSAYFEAVIAIHDPNTKTTQIFSGKTAGEITQKPQGKLGFGYDPIFFSTDLQKTFAQSTTEEKNRVSHRGRALNQAIQVLWKNSSCSSLPLF